MRFLIPATAIILAACGTPAATPTQASPARDATATKTLSPGEVVTAPVILTAADGLKVHGTYSRVGGGKALILLFHQAGSGRGEYATIQPRLARLGFSSLAIDQRSGGSLFGVNETATALGHDAGYDDARQDLEAAMAFGVNEGPPVILWGSSYSAALVFEVAAMHRDDVAGVMSFSPGEYLGGTRVADSAALIQVPVYITSAKEPGEIAAAAKIGAAVPKGATVFVPPTAGVHGSSTLIPARDPAGAEENWRSVEAFLKPFR